MSTSRPTQSKTLGCFKALAMWIFHTHQDFPVTCTFGKIPERPPHVLTETRVFHRHKILLLQLLQQVLREIRQDLSFICRSKPLSSIGIRKTYLMNIIILVGISDSQNSYLILTKLYFFLLIFPQFYCLVFLILWERPVPVSGMVPFYT